MSRGAKYTLAGVLGLGLLAIVIGSPWIIEAPVWLLIGWVQYLIRVVPMVRVNVSAVAVFVIAIPVTLVLGHHLLSWLWREAGAARANSDFAAAVSRSPELLCDVGAMVGATEAAAFVEAESGTELRLIAHIRPGEADDATKRDAIEAFTQMSQTCLENGKDGFIHVRDAGGIEPQFCLVLLQRFAGKPRIANCFVIRALDDLAAEELLARTQPFIRENKSGVREPAREAWRWKWSVAGLSMLMLMFVIGTAATGIVHQTGWLITSPKPLVVSSARASWRVKCGSNLRQIHYALLAYRDVHPGFRPTAMKDVIDIALAADAGPDCFVCVGSNQDRAPGTQPAEQRDAMLASPERYLSYILSAPGTVGPDNERLVLLYEAMENHEDGINVLYEDGTVAWLDEPAARAWLEGLGVERRKSG